MHAPGYGLLLLITLTSILLSFDLRKSEVGERKKRTRSWCDNYLFLMSLLQVSNEINHQGNFKGNLLVTRCENSKSHITLLCPITLHAAYLDPITHHADTWVPSRVTEIPFATLVGWEANTFFDRLTCLLEEFILHFISVSLVISCTTTERHD